MSFLKISGLVIGAGSVVGGTGAGIYYVANRKNNEKEDIQKSKEQLNPKTEFVGKLVFEKKSDDNYEMKFLSATEYSAAVSTFDSSASDGKKYINVNKIVDISHLLNVENTKTKLKEIWSEPSSLASIKSKILPKSAELKELFNEDIYTKLKTEFGVSEN